MDMDLFYRAKYQTPFRPSPRSENPSTMRTPVSPSITRPGVVSLALLLLILPQAAPAAGIETDGPLEKVTFKAETPSGRSLGERTIAGQVVRDLGHDNLLLLDRGGRLWPIPADRFIERETTEEKFTPFTMDEMATALQEELGDGFIIVKTRHYILCSEANREYARWAGSLFERLLSAFDKLWRRRIPDLAEPRFPLCAIILKDKQRYQEFAVEESGSEVLDAFGYYSTLTNRMVMYDLTGGQTPRNPRELNRLLNQQINNVTTIVHEATHQVAFNTNIHTRLAPNPFWLVEGLAMFFETPDLSNPNGWRTVGALNTARLRDFHRFRQSRRKPGSLREIISQDDRLKDSETALDAYSEAWALSYYLIWARRDDYAAYLKALAEKEMLSEQTEDERIALFEEHFGKIDEVEQAMLQHLARKSR